MINEETAGNMNRSYTQQVATIQLQLDRFYGELGDKNLAAAREIWFAMQQKGGEIAEQIYKPTNKD